jgi:DNA-binding transcriptional LysR family regulator
MDFDQMRAVVEVARLRSFSRAAETLGLTQPAVSAQVRLIEEEVGCRLFDRLGRSVYLTQPGALLLDYAKRMLELRRQAVEAVSDLRRPSARLTIGATESICLYLLPAVLKQYQAQHPGVAISIFRHNTDRVVRKLLEGVLDVGFISLPTEHPDLQIERVMRDRWVAALPWSHPLAARDSLTLEELIDSPFILPEMGHTRQELDRMLLPYRKRLKVAFEASGVELIKRLVASGMGVTIIGEGYAQTEAAVGKLKIVPLRALGASREIGVAVRKGQALPAAARELIAVAKKIAARATRDKAAAVRPKRTRR